MDGHIGVLCGRRPGGGGHAQVAGRGAGVHAGQYRGGAKSPPRRPRARAGRKPQTRPRGVCPRGWGGRGGGGGLLGGGGEAVAREAGGGELRGRRVPGGGVARGPRAALPRCCAGGVPGGAWPRGPGGPASWFSRRRVAASPRCSVALLHCPVAALPYCPVVPLPAVAEPLGRKIGLWCPDYSVISSILCRALNLPHGA